MNSSSASTPDLAAPSVEDLLAHGQWIRSFCRTLVGPVEGEDLAQETWMAALRRPPRRAGNPRAWLAQVARNLAASRRRQGLGRRRREERVARPEAQAAESDLVATTELSHVVAGEVLALDEPFRTTVLLRYVEGLRTPEIARRMEVADATVRSRLARGLERVRERLDERNGGERERWLAVMVPWVGVPSHSSKALPLAAAGVLVTGGAFWVWQGGTHGSASDPTGTVRVAAVRADSELATGGQAGSRRATEQQRENATDRVALGPPPGASEGRGFLAPQVVWRYQDSSRGAPLIEGDHVYVVGERLAKLAAIDGLPVWERAREAKGSWIGPGALAGRRLLCAHSTGGVAAFDTETGEQLWARSSEELGTQSTSGRVVHRGGGAVYVAPTGSGLVALRIRDGAEVWRADLGGAVRLTPAVQGEKLFAGTQAGDCFALRVEDGSVAWKSGGHGQFAWTNPVVGEGRVFLGDRGIGGSSRPGDTGKLVSEVQGNRAGALHAFDAATGEHLWGRIFGATGLSEPFVDTEHVWIGFGKTCLALGLERGTVDEERIVRTGSNPFGSPRVLGEQLIFGNLDGHLYAHHAATGELQWALSLRGNSQVGSWRAAHGRLYVNTSEGLLALEDDVGADPLEPGSRVAMELPRAVQTEGASAEDQEERLAAATFESFADLSQGWLHDLHPTALNDRERKQFELPSVREQKELETDPELRSLTLEALRRALTGKDLTHKSAALWTLGRCSGIGEIETFAPLVRDLATTSPATLRMNAVGALVALERWPGDLELAQEAWDVVSPSERLELPRLLVRLGDGQLRGRSTELVDELLDGIDSASFRLLGSSLWGADLEESTSRRIVELATQPQFEPMRYDAIYYVLSTARPKSSAVVGVLTDALRDENLETSRRALWGLTYGIQEADQPQVVEALLAIPDPLYRYEQHRIERLVKEHGTPDQIARLRN